MNRPDLSPRRGVRVLRYALLALAGSYPFAMAYGTFAGIEPLDRLAVWRALAGSCTAPFLINGLARFVIADPDARAMCVALALLACSTYGLALIVLSKVGVHLLDTSLVVATAYVVVVAVLVTLVVRPWRAKRRDLVPLALVAATLVGLNVYRGAARVWTSPESRWHASADEIVGSAMSGPRSVPAIKRDIYYIILDGFGRADTLREDYGLDLQSFVDFLRARGFYVAEEARSNYAQTLLSFSSVLNLGYFDALGASMGRDNKSWLPLADLIQRNALMRLAKDAGYEVAAIGSDYGPTKRFSEADVCFCEQRGLDMFEQVVLSETVFGALPLDPWTYGAHRRKILDALSTLERLPPAPSGRLVFVHILSPHPPFTFGSDGAFHRPNRPFMFNEGSDFPGPKEEYVRGYHDQAEFLTKRLHDVIETILSRSGPRPVIVMHGDHGPGSMLQQDDPVRTNMRERMNIFAAYYFPEGRSRLYASMTPVNGVRALTNEFLGTDLARLPDASWFSTEEHPYDFMAVPAELKSVIK